MACIEASEYWQLLMMEYIDKSACMLQLGPKLNDYLASLKQMNDSEFVPLETLLSLAKLIKDLPDMERELRRFSCDELKNLLWQKMEKIWASCGTPEVTKEYLRNTQSFFQDALAIYPWDGKLQEYMEQCAAKMLEYDTKQFVKEVVEATDGILSTDKKDLKTMEKHIQSLHVCMNSTMVKKEDVCGEAADKLTQAVTIMWEVIHIAWDAKTAEPTIVNIIMAGFTKLLEVLDIDGFKECLEALKAGCSMASSYLGLQNLKTKDQPKEEEVLEQMLLTLRRMQRFKKAAETPKGKDKTCIVNLLDVLKDVYEPELTKMKAEITRVREENLKKAIKGMSNVAGGMDSGQVWKDNFTGTTFNMLKTYAADNLAKCEPGKLMPVITNLEEATPSTKRTPKDEQHVCL
eukprot:5577045-Amphidinium_carterae.3